MHGAAATLAKAAAWRGKPLRWRQRPQLEALAVSWDARYSLLLSLWHRKRRT